MITTQKLHVFATKIGLGTDQHSLTQALQSISCPSNQILAWIAHPESIPDTFAAAIDPYMDEADLEIASEIEPVEPESVVPATQEPTPEPVIEPTQEGQAAQEEQSQEEEQAAQEEGTASDEEQAPSDEA